MFWERLLDALKYAVRLYRQLDSDWVTGLHHTARDDYPHDASLAHQLSLRRAAQNRCRKASLILIELLAWIAQPCEFDDG